MNTLKELAQKETYYNRLYRLVDTVFTNIENKKVSVKSALEMLNGYCDEFPKMYTKKQIGMLRAELRIKAIEATRAYNQAW